MLGRHLLSVLPLLLMASACSRPEPLDRRPYTPLFQAAVEAARAHPQGTIAAAFAEAASAKTLGEAVQRWEVFLKRYPPDMETEDAVQKRYIDAAAYELIRTYYLLGRQQDGDGLLLSADPLKLR